MQYDGVRGHTRRDVDDFKVGENQAAVVGSDYGSGPLNVRWVTVVRKTATQIVTKSGVGEIRWSRGKYDHDFYMVGSRELWNRKPLYPAGDSRIESALRQQEEREAGLRRLHEIKKAQELLLSNAGYSWTAGPSDDKVRAAIRLLAPLLPEGPALLAALPEEESEAE